MCFKKKKSRFDYIFINILEKEFVFIIRINSILRYDKSMNYLKIKTDTLAP